ncbi:hypothetical protein CK215_05420 [Mesorhizobium sp. WSM3864]|nr:hypothetical protein CK215_05420 [Mesorhizobium sp. WSM3864]
MSGRNCGASVRVAGQGIAMESPHGNTHPAAPRGIFSDYGAGMLIVPMLFFIQRRDGEVAEWSKALPC